MVKVMGQTKKLELTLYLIGQWHIRTDQTLDFIGQKDGYFSANMISLVRVATILSWIDCDRCFVLKLRGDRIIIDHFQLIFAHIYKSFSNP
jgi:hypothetical protein